MKTITVVTNPLKDENFIYKINVFDSEISSETVIDMIRNLYKNN